MKKLWIALLVLFAVVGIVTFSHGYELAFGFGEYGTHHAVMTYTVTNFVENLEDGAQAVYWEFIPKNMTPAESVTISLTNAEGVTFNEENARIWEPVSKAKRKLRLRRW